MSELQRLPASLPSIEMPSGVIGELRYDIDAQMTIVYTGHGWMPLPNDSMIRYCIYCTKAEWAHNEKLIADHPFIFNNLEFLEWKSECKNASTEL